MPSQPATVNADVQVRLVVENAAALPLRATMTYDAADPYAVTIAFHAGASEAVQWTFARQLLTDGVTGSAGHGDVRTWPGADEQGQIVCLSLRSPQGSALFQIPVPELVEFLAMSYAAVPTGTESEHVDLDAGLADLLPRDPDVF